MNFSSFPSTLLHSYWKSAQYSSIWRFDLIDDSSQLIQYHPHNASYPALHYTTLSLSHITQPSPPLSPLFYPTLSFLSWTCNIHVHFCSYIIQHVIICSYVIIRIKTSNVNHAIYSHTYYNTVYNQNYCYSCFFCRLLHTILKTEKKEEVKEDLVWG